MKLFYEEILFKNPKYLGIVAQSEKSSWGIMKKPMIGKGMSYLLNEIIKEYKIYAI